MYVYRAIKHKAFCKVVMFYICKKHVVVRLYLFLIVTPNIVKVICIKESMLPLKFTCIRVECDWILDCMKNSMVVIQQ